MASYPCISLRWLLYINNLIAPLKPLSSSVSSLKARQQFFLIFTFRLDQFKTRNTEQMSSTSRACVVAASVAVVEALKDQGICRWNYPIRWAYQGAKSRARSLSQAKMLSPSSHSLVGSSKIREEERVSQSEESLRKVMYLSCWGPN